MSWHAVTWMSLAVACLTLAAIHAQVWLQRREALANAAFAVLAASVACLGYFELRMLQATSIAEFGRMLWWYHWPVWTGLIALVCFVRLYLRAGRPWLGWTIVALRTIALAINLVSAPNINYMSVAVLEKVEVFGEALSVARGVTNPLLVIAQLSLLATVVFVADATVAVWRRGERRRAISIGGSLVLFVGTGSLLAILSFWGLARLPIFVALLFAPIVFAMAFELSLDLIHAARVSAELDAKTRALRTSERKLALAVEAANAGLWSIEPGTGRLWATPRALSMFGLPPSGDHRIDDVLRLVHPEDREALREFVLSRGPATDAIEYRMVGPGGEIRWHAMRGRRAHLEGEESMGAMVDVTQRKRAEDEAAAQRAHLEHLSRVATLSELSGALAHELNQPLAIILSNAQAAQRLLQDPQPDLEEVCAILDDIVEADSRAGEVIVRLRGMLKRGTPNAQPVSLNALVEDVVRFMHADLLRRGISLELTLGADIPTIRADRIPLEQVLINLIANAEDAMANNPPGERCLCISTRHEANMVHMRIADCGAGLPVPPDRVFTPFYTTKPEGLGLGLAISRSIVTAHGGRLWAEPNGKKGAAFSVSLPFAA